MTSLLLVEWLGILFPKENKKEPTEKKQYD